MDILYVKDSCPFCAVVLKEVDDLGIEVELRNIADNNHKEILVITGGKVQVPFLHDPECGIAMYESGDIVAYFRDKYHQGKNEEPVAPENKVCPT